MEELALEQRIGLSTLCLRGIPLEEAIDRALDAGLQVGDQIQVDGLLASYGNGGGYQRGTSTVRTDTGNGACETIFVKSVSVLAEMQSIWRWLTDLAMWSSVASGVLWLVGVGRGAF